MHVPVPSQVLAMVPIPSEHDAVPQVVFAPGPTHAPVESQDVAPHGATVAHVAVQQCPIPATPHTLLAHSEFPVQVLPAGAPLDEPDDVEVLLDAPPPPPLLDDVLVVVVVVLLVVEPVLLAAAFEPLVEPPVPAGGTDTQPPATMAKAAPPQRRLTDLLVIRIALP